MGGLGIIMSSGEVSHLPFQIWEEGFAKRGVCMGFIAHHEREWGLLDDRMGGGAV